MKRLSIILLLFLSLSACKQSAQRTSSITDSSASLQDTTPLKDTATSAHYSQPGKAANATITRNNKGTGPVNRVILTDTINYKMAKHGKQLFANHCASCHHLNHSATGPALSNVLQKRSPEFVMNMILNTREMLEKDPTIQSLRATYKTEMIQVDLTRKEARAIVEYLRTNNKIPADDDWVRRPPLTYIP